MRKMVGTAPRALVVAALTASCAGLVSCSDGAAVPATTTVPVSVDAEVLSSLCSGVVAAGLGDGTLCADSGFRMESDRFSFTNWGRSVAADDNVTLQTLIDLFGHSQVCMPGAQSECVLRPRTVQALHDWNVALAGGRCEGMAVLSQRMFLGYDTPQEFGGSFATAADVPRSARDLAPVLTHWWATQFVPEVARAAAASRLRTPGQLVADLIEGLENDAGHTIGLYHRGAGHSVTPFAVTRRGDTWVVHVYDNNDPRTRHELLVRPSEATWRYEGPTGTWEGSTGTMEVTPLDVRGGPFTCDFCSGADGGTTITVASQDGPARPMLLIDAGGLGTVEQTADGFRSTIEGASIAPGKGRGGSVTVRLPATAGPLRIELRGTDGVPHAPATVTVRRAGHADLQVREAAPGAPTGAARAVAPLLMLDPEGTTVTAAGGAVQVVAAGGSNLGRVPVERDHTLIVSRVERGADGDTVAMSYENPSIPGSSVLEPFTLELEPSVATDTEIIPKNGVLTASASPTQARPASPARQFRSSPLPRDTTRSTAPRGTVPSVDVTLPG
ncbi:MAG: hypothetical protein ACO36A_06670 [Ilumatobacteraceae bacterium]